MRERTRAALNELIVAYLADPTKANMQALYDRAPLGNYYVYLDDGTRAILDIDEEGGCGCAIDEDYVAEEEEEAEAA